MSSEEELLRLQKILAAAVVVVALSVGIGGFDTLKIWYQLDLTETQTDYDGWDIDEESELKFSLEGLEIEYSRTTDYNDGSESYSTSESYDVDYGEDGIFEETESAMANIQRGGYLVAALILFVIWKLQEMKAETNEEIRGEIITQIRNALKGAGALVALILLYYLMCIFEDI